MIPSIIFDFDGTLAVGHGPVRAYARFAAPAAAPDFLHRVEAALADYDAGHTAYRDGYDVIASLAAEDSVPAETLSAAYASSRTELGTERAPVESMPGLDDFLAAVGRHARLVLATNAPAEGVDRVLHSWGVRERFDDVHFTVGKPAGLTPILEDALSRGPVLAVGDIVDFDLAPALALGADTALVGATAATSPAAVTLRAASLAELSSDIQSWAAAAATTVASER